MRIPAIIAYGADHARRAAPGRHLRSWPAARYALAIARAEPENNLDIVLIRAFIPDADATAGHRRQLVADAPWPAVLRAAWEGTRNLHMVEAEYDPGRLRAIRDRAWLYLHGHSMPAAPTRRWSR
jgi:hypothetical protein